MVLVASRRGFGSDDNPSQSMSLEKGVTRSGDFEALVACYRALHRCFPDTPPQGQESDPQDRRDLNHTVTVDLPTLLTSCGLTWRGLGRNPAYGDAESMRKTEDLDFPFSWCEERGGKCLPMTLLRDPRPSRSPESVANPYGNRQTRFDGSSMATTASPPGRSHTAYVQQFLSPTIGPPSSTPGATPLVPCAKPSARCSIGSAEQQRLLHWERGRERRDGPLLSAAPHPSSSVRSSPANCMRPLRPDRERAPFATADAVLGKHQLRFIEQTHVHHWAP